MFDDLGRLKERNQTTDGRTYTSKCTYNLSGVLIEEEYPSGRKVENECESDGDITRIYGSATPTATERTYANAFSYTPDGRIEKLRLGNGLWEAAKFNTRLQVTELALGRGVASGDVWKLGYEYGELQTDGTVNAAKNTGNIAKQILSFGGLAQPFVQTYKYDSLYRLTEARETAGTGGSAPQTWRETFGYDRYGNRTAHDKFHGTNLIAATNLTHPTIDPATNRITTAGYGFDKNGNLVADPEDRDFFFNGDNKQRKVEVSGQLVGEYFYDGEGKRVKKKTYNAGVLSEETLFVYSNGKLIAEYSTAALPQNPTTSWTVTDQLGSPRVIVNSLGEVVSRRDFLPFGEQAPNDASYRTTNLYPIGDSIRQKFTGYQKDEETQLDFAEARMYENRHARFTAVDPLLASGKSANPQTFNRYVYVMNNPLVYTDPTGLQAGNRTGPVYYSVAADGRWAFSNRSGTSAVTGINYDKRYTGGPVRITGIDGYQYTITAKGWRQHGLDLVAAERSAKTGSSASKSQSPTNDALRKDLGKRGPALLKIMTALAALMVSPAAGPLLPTMATGAGTAATTAGSAPLSVTGPLTAAATFGIGTTAANLANSENSSERRDQQVTLWRGVPYAAPGDTRLFRTH